MFNSYAKLAGSTTDVVGHNCVYSPSMSSHRVFNNGPESQLGKRTSLNLIKLCCKSPLVNVYIAMEISIFNGQIHYFYGHFPYLC